MTRKNSDSCNYPEVEKRSKKVTLRAAVEHWLEDRCENSLKLLLSGAATKPKVKLIMDELNENDGSSSDGENRRQNPIRKAAFHDDYKKFFTMQASPRPGSSCSDKLILKGSEEEESSNGAGSFVSRK